MYFVDMTMTKLTYTHRVLLSLGAHIGHDVSDHANDLWANELLSGTRYG